MLYGILLESARDGICLSYGDQVWKRIVEELNFEHDSFTTLGRYEDNLIEKIAECKTKDPFYRFLFISNLFSFLKTKTQKVWPIYYVKEHRIIICNFLANVSFVSLQIMVMIKFFVLPEDILEIFFIRLINFMIQRNLVFLE